MGKLSKPNQSKTISDTIKHNRTEPTLQEQCTVCYNIFESARLKSLEIFIPVGLVIDGHDHYSYVRKLGKETPNDRVISQAVFGMDWNDAMGLRMFFKLRLPRAIECETINRIGIEVKSMLGDKYTYISRVITNLENIESITDEFVGEANRFYLLYCQPVELKKK